VSITFLATREEGAAESQQQAARVVSEDGASVCSRTHPPPPSPAGAQSPLTRTTVALRARARPAPPPQRY
jgi:hypothetical protein